MNAEAHDQKLRVRPPHVGSRLDHYLVHHFPDHSRAALGRLIKSGAVLVNGREVKAGQRLRLDDSITIAFPPPEPLGLVPRPVTFTILYEDRDVLVLDKPPGLVVHPGDGHRQDTLVNELLSLHVRLPAADPERPGIVHRLDRDTSGVMVVALREQAMRGLTEQFMNREVDKTYLALLVRGPAENRGRLEAAIGRHPKNRKKMAVRQDGKGRWAATSWQVERRWPGFALVRIRLETGRTHQIRVHMASLGCPVAGDRLYGGQLPAKSGWQAPRQMLHAHELAFRHPLAGHRMAFTSPLPEDMTAFLARLDSHFGTEEESWC